MADLSKILFGKGSKTYVDVTPSRAPSKKKAPIFLKRRPKKSLKAKNVPACSALTRIKKRNLIKPLPKIKSILKKKNPASDFFTKIMQPVHGTANPFQGHKVIAPQKNKVLVGNVTHFFDKIQVCVVHVQKTLKVGDVLHFKGKTTDFKQKLVSMQIDHKPVDVAVKDQEIGLKVKKQVDVGDEIFIT